MEGADHVTSPRHAAVVRVTHWVNAMTTLALVISGVAILLAHPRLYWGETGAVGTPSLIDLPIPFWLGHSGWGRSLHFLAAWVSVFGGLVYVISGLITRHFRRRLLPSKADLAWSNMSRVMADHVRFRRSHLMESGSYNVLQRLAYTVVVFLLFPLIILSGLAFSPAIASVAPAIVTAFAGQQSARTIHFFAGTALVLFALVHIVMVSLAGFRNRVRDMIVGGTAD